MSVRIQGISFTTPSENWLDLIEQAVSLYDNKLVYTIQHHDGESLMTRLQNGDITVHDVLAHLADDLEHSSNGIFAFPMATTEVKNTFHFGLNFMESDPSIGFLEVSMAQILGLPDKNPATELRELKELLAFVKNSCIKEQEWSTRIAVARGLGPTVIELTTDGKTNLEFKKRIENSPVLTQWADRTKRGIENTHTHVDTLFHSMSVVNLFNTAEKIHMANAEDSLHDHARLLGF